MQDDITLFQGKRQRGFIRIITVCKCQMIGQKLDLDPIKNDLKMTNVKNLLSLCNTCNCISAFFV